MKKYLPFIIFIIVFAAVLAGQVGYKMFYVSKIPASNSKEYQEYENLFLHADYKNVKGQSVEIAKLNSPVVIYNFWASWCIPCMSEMPSMLSMKKKFKADELQIISINTDEDNQIENIKKTMQKIGIKDEFILIPDKTLTLVNQFKVSAIPVTIVFHRGKVVELSNGPMDFNSEEFFEKMKGWTAN